MLLHYPAARRRRSKPGGQDAIPEDVPARSVVLRTLLPQVSTGTVFSGVLPFMWADLIRLAILVAFPIISLWLPSMMR